jgi:hypothetical protein
MGGCSRRGGRHTCARCRTRSRADRDGQLLAYPDEICVAQVIGLHQRGDGYTMTRGNADQCLAPLDAVHARFGRRRTGCRHGPAGHEQPLTDVDEIRIANAIHLCQGSRRDPQSRRDVCQVVARPDDVYALLQIWRCPSADSPSQQNYDQQQPGEPAAARSSRSFSPK